MAELLIQWRDELARRMDAGRTRIATLRSYADGHAPAPVAANEKTRDAWRSFQRRSRTNFGELIIEALAERLIPNGVKATDDDARTRAMRVWRRNRLSVAFADTFRDALTVGRGYMFVTTSTPGEALITSEAPEFVEVDVDPHRPWLPRAVLRVWRDRGARTDYAAVWVDGEHVTWSRAWSSDERAEVPASVLGGTWIEVPESREDYVGAPPVFVFENHDGTGEFEPHLDVLNRINAGILDRLVTSATQAFRQLAVSGVPMRDAAGNLIDYAKIFAPGPDALWVMPTSETGLDPKIWESKVTDMGPMLEAVKADVLQLAAVTRTPSATLLPSADNQSAEGAAFAREGLVFKARDRIDRFTAPGEEMLERALRAEGVDADLELQFAPPEHVSLNERTNAANQAIAAGVPWREVMAAVMGFSPTKIDELEVLRAQEQLATAAFLGDGNAA